MRECNSKEGDFTGFYTECDVASVTREYHYQFEEGVKCTGGEKLPEPNVGLPCGQGCEPGSFLPVGELECQECEAGFFSFFLSFIYSDFLFILIYSYLFLFILIYSYLFLFILIYSYLFLFILIYSYLFLFILI